MQMENSPDCLDSNRLIDHVTDRTFHDTVIRSNKTVLVDFWAPWCGPCRLQTPILMEVAKEVSDRAKVVKLNIDENPVLAEALRIEVIPMLAVFKNGKMQNAVTGLKPKQEIIDLIDSVTV